MCDVLVSVSVSARNLSDQPKAAKVERARLAYTSELQSAIKGGQGRGIRQELEQRPRRTLFCAWPQACSACFFYPTDDQWPRAAQSTILIFYPTSVENKSSLRSLTQLPDSGGMLGMR